MNSLAEIIHLLFNLYTFVLIARVFLTWIPIDRKNPIYEFIVASTDPLLRPIARIIPPIGGMLDISPIIALVLLNIVEQLVIALIAN